MFVVKKYARHNLYLVRPHAYVHTHTSVLNLHLCTHDTQQRCCNVVVVSQHIRRIYWYVHTYHTYVSDVLRFCLFPTNPGLALVEE